VTLGAKRRRLDTQDAAQEQSGTFPQPNSLSDYVGMAHAYDVYLLQLAGSTYGLRQPLYDGLRHFGRWHSESSYALAARRRELRSIITSYAVP